MRFDELFEQRSLVASKLKDCMRDKGYTKVSFAKKAEISRPTLDKLLNGSIDSKATFDRHLQKILKMMNMSVDELETYDVIYLTGGRTSYLLERINDTGFRDTLLTYIRDGGFVIGVSAGSIIFANNLPGNLALLDTKLDVHCDASSYTGKVFFPMIKNMKLSNTAAILIRSIPDDMEIVDG